MSGTKAAAAACSDDHVASDRAASATTGAVSVALKWVADTRCSSGGLQHRDWTWSRPSPMCRSIGRRYTAQWNIRFRVIFSCRVHQSECTLHAYEVADNRGSFLPFNF